jgi:two-component system, LuxR family, response regulator FixJ
MNSKPIYVVDDDPSVRGALKRLLGSHGFTVKTFSSGQRFLEFVGLNAEGVLILDIRMPDMDGLVLQQKLNYSCSPLKIIFMTAWPGPGDKECAVACGAIGFLIKPFGEWELLNLIEAASRGEHSQHKVVK